VAPLKHQHAQPGAREVARGHQPVVPGTDHDGVVTRGAQAKIVPRWAPRLPAPPVASSPIED
jgi:hypothetical protein